MRFTKILATLTAIMLVLLSMTACSKSNLPEDAIRGSWAYIHDKDTAIAIFNKNGTAQYEGQEYTYTCDSQFIYLTDTQGGTVSLRYTLVDNGLDIYVKTDYTYQGEGAPNSLVGDWHNEEKNWAFSFSDSGTFLEDTYFGGTYEVNTDNSTFTLTYEDQFEETMCYYQVDENKLYIEYPWRMVTTGSK